MWVERRLPEVEELPIDDAAWLLNPKSLGMNYHTVASPASEVFSVELYCNSFTVGKTCEVYGEINVEDGCGASYKLYCRDPDNAQTVTQKHKTLSLCMPIECAVSCTWVRMRISLKDRVDDSVIVEEVLSLVDGTREVDYDQVKVREVCGVGGSASVRYAAFSTAVLAVVQITLVEKDMGILSKTKRKKSKKKGKSYTPDVFGKIVARYGNTYGAKYPAIMLFERPSNQSVEAVAKTPIHLSRDVVVVPAYPFLTIDVDLFDSRTNQPVVNGKAEFLASHCHMASEDLQCKDFIIRVNVEWFHPYKFEKEREKLSKHPKMSDDQQECPASSLSISKEPYLRKHRAIGFSLLEVFSVMIGHSNNNVLDMYGLVRVRDDLMNHIVFNRHPWNPENLFGDSKTISIEGPCECFDAPEGMAIGLNLCDVRGQVVIKGDITWGLSSMVSPISWYDRRMCSVIRGVQGYASVFYSIFSRAVQALVKVSFISNGSSDNSHRVHGTIVTKYNNEDYSTEYERKYYQSVLFNQPQENSSKLKSGCRIPLLKSVVAVPIDASLIVEVDLYASSLDRFPGEHLKGVTEFAIAPDAHIFPVLQSKNYRIELSVEWSKLYRLRSR